MNMDKEQETIQAASREWQNKLMGKHLVRELKEQTEHDEVLEADLPKPHRVLTKGSIMTRDFHPDRLNVILDDEDLIENVYFG